MDMRYNEMMALSQLLAQAKASTGLSDFGPDHFMEPLSVLVRAMSDEAALHDEGAKTHAGRIVNALENRLRKQDLLKRHPEILDQKVDVAAVIVGLPRTGSTMLHRLLASSPKATAMVWWETIFPLPRDDADPQDIEKRKADAKALADSLVAASEGFEAMHPLNAFAHDEELPLIEQSFISNIPEAMLHIPSYGEWLLNADQTHAYGELIDWLKILQWQSPERQGQKWVLKAPHHLTAVQTTLDAFPNAVMVMTHRRIDHVMGSWYSIVGSLTGGNTVRDFSKEQAAHWTQRLRRNLVDMMAARERSPDRFVDVQYKALLADPIAHARMVFNAAGLDVDEADLNAWSAWLNGNQRDNRPSHKYDVADYGLSVDQLQREFAFYSDRYVQA